MAEAENFEKEVSENNIVQFSELAADFSKLCFEDKCSDVTFVVSGERIPAHKAILLARSSYFEEDLSDPAKNEIIFESTDPATFKTILKYIYSGQISLTTPTTESVLEVLILAEKFVLTHLISALVENFKSLLTTGNIVSILNIAHDHQMHKLINTCELFLDKHAEEILAHDSFLGLSEASLVGILMRDSFHAPEIDIFKAVAKWSGNDKEKAREVINWVRFTLMSPLDIAKIVKPTGLVDSDNLLNIIEYTLSEKVKLSSRGVLELNTNMAAIGRGATVVSGQDPEFLLNGDSKNYTNQTGFTYHIIEKEQGSRVDGIMVELKEVTIVNNIRMLLNDSNRIYNYYNYYVEVSTDKENWVKVIDYASYECRSWQDLYFERRAVKFINIVGTLSSFIKNQLRLVTLEVYCRLTSPQISHPHAVIYPNCNVTSLKNKAIAWYAQGKTDNACLDGNFRDYDARKGFSSAKINDSKYKFTIELNQPYMIVSMRMLLLDVDDRSYSFYIETSVDYEKWEILVDKRDERCKSWQSFNFQERPVIYMRFTGTYSSASDTLDIVYLECPIESHAPRSLRIKLEEK